LYKYKKVLHYGIFSNKNIAYRQCDQIVVEYHVTSSKMNFALFK